LSPSIEPSDFPEPPEAPSEAVNAQLDDIRARFNVLLHGFFHDSDAGTPIYDQLKKEYDDEERFNELLASGATERLHYGTFV